MIIFTPGYFLEKFVISNSAKLAAVEKNNIHSFREFGIQQRAF